VPAVKSEQLDPAYVRRLIQQINDLESDGNSVNTEKIRQLNAELDAILTILRQR